MRILFKVLASILLLIGTAAASVYLFGTKPKSYSILKYNMPAEETGYASKTMTRLKHRAMTLESDKLSDKFSSRYCFMIDMKIPSSQKRFFVYDLKKDSVMEAGLVTHGSGSSRGDTNLYFGNVPGSNCTSIGRYRIGNSYEGKFGLAYKLYGLDRTNSKAFERFVVLHAHGCVPDLEVAPLSICESWGCPTVSPTFLLVLKKYIERSEKPIMLWIYY